MNRKKLFLNGSGLFFSYSPKQIKWKLTFFFLNTKNISSNMSKVSAIPLALRTRDFADILIPHEGKYYLYKRPLTTMNQLWLPADFKINYLQPLHLATDRRYLSHIYHILHRDSTRQYIITVCITTASATVTGMRVDTSDTLLLRISRWELHTLVMMSPLLNRKKELAQGISQKQMYWGLASNPFSVFSQTAVNWVFWLFTLARFI